MPSSRTRHRGTVDGAPRRRSRDLLRLRVGIDSGGTFTDLVALGGGIELAFKLPSTPDDPARAVERALDELGRRLADRLPRRLARHGRAPPVELEVVHGTTVATNALLEGRAARVVFVTNAGFEDLLEIGRQARPDLYDLHPRRPPPLVDRALRMGVDERTLADGTRLRRPSGRELDALLRRVRAARPEALAIGLLHAWREPAGEREIERALRRLRLPISRSSDVAPLLREYERFSTTVANSALAPLCRRYLGRLARRRARTRLFVLQSNGGLTTARAAARAPVRIVLSGPAGGVAAAHSRLRAAGAAGAITLDMGGTSTDLGLVLGEPRRTDQVDLDGRPLLVDALEIHSIGAGGGSRLWIDDGGSLRVGPRSSGADPGPACYGRGVEPCLTDAHALLGRLPLEERLGGAIALDAGRSLAAIAPLARRLRASPVAVAAAALDVADAAMERAMKRVSLERGHDPRELALFVFGGAGGLHACRLARRLGMREVIVPPWPGATSAWGMATSDARLAVAQGLVREVDGRAGAELERAFARLSARARRELRSELGPGPVRIERVAACRYRGQSFELQVPFARDLRRRFEALHQQRFGFRHSGSAVECVALHVAAIRRSPPPRRGAARDDPRAARLEPVLARFPDSGDLEPRRVPRLRRDELRPGRTVRGPFVLLESTATTIVEPGFQARVDSSGCLRLGLRP